MSIEFQKRAAELVLQARESKGLSQGEFGKLVGKTQSVISKYEKGLTAVPGEIVIRCISMLGLPNGAEPSVDEVTELVRKLISDPTQGSLRRALAGLFASLEQATKRS